MSTFASTDVFVSPALPLHAAPTLREVWLSDAVSKLEPLFTAQGYQLPQVKVSVGFASKGAHNGTIGQCWSTESAADRINQIFISPVLQEPVAVLDTLVHELVHAIDDCKHRHGAPFRKIATAIGLEGQMRSASAGEALRQRLTVIASSLAPYPHGALAVGKARRASRAPRPRARCESCGYEVPMLKRFLSFGSPICPKDNIAMQQLGNWQVSQAQ